MDFCIHVVQNKMSIQSDPEKSAFHSRNSWQKIKIKFVAIHSIKSVQKIPADINTVWDFFSSASNLEKITPKNLGFTVISHHHGDKIYPGQIIEYKISPLLGIPLYWMTEITHVKDREYFADEQRHGPYSMWQHQHHFKQIEAGVEMTDIVHYRMPFWILGDMAHSLLVKAQLRDIFRFRGEQVIKHFGKWGEAKPTELIFIEH